MKKVAVCGALFLAACGNPPGPSVPMQSGENLYTARLAVNACAPHAPRGGDNAVVGGYISSVVLLGVVGPIIVASNEENIRAGGEANAVDRCLADKGFKRRDLTDAEMAALNSRDANGRAELLDHLIGGGTLESFRSV